MFCAAFWRSGLPFTKYSQIYGIVALTAKEEIKKYSERHHDSFS
jgi:hypothetical protein